MGELWPRRFVWHNTSVLKNLYLTAAQAFIVIALAVSLPAQEGQFDINVSPLPEPTSPVMDYAGVMDEATRQRIADKILAFSESSSPKVEMGVAVVKTTEGRDIFEYSLAVARGWGIGTTAEDNPGLLLLVAIDDRKYFTQVSDDLGDELPDGLVGSLQRQYLVPEFRAGNYGKGIEDTIDAYIERIKAAQSGAPLPADTPERVYEKDFVDRAFDMVPNWLCRAICCLAILLFFISLASSGKNQGGGGGGGGSGGGDILAALLAGILAGGSSSSGWSSGSSGWSSGGSSGWSGGGGFGGFSGGGGFGGGGAGGGW